MLPDRLCQLLTAYLDGALTARRRQAVEHLLERSAEARELLRRLQGDAEKLRRLPRRQLGPTFATQVLQAIGERRLSYGSPGRRRTLSERPRIPAWAGLAAAASVLLTVGVASYLYFEAAQRWQADQEAAHQQRESPQPSEKPAEVPAPLPLARQDTTPPEEKPGPVDKLPAPEIAHTQGKPPAPAPPQPPGPTEPAELAGPNIPKPESLEVVHPGLAHTLALRDLEQEKVGQHLRKELQRENAYRLELFCLGNGKALDRLQAAFKAHGIRLVIDPEVHALKSRKVRTEYALYTEGLTAEDLARVLERLGREDKQAEAKRRGEGQFDRVLVFPLTPASRKELTSLLGIDPLVAPARPKTPLGVDIHQPVASGTAAQVAQALDGQGPSRSESGKPAAARASERLAVVLHYNPSRPRPTPSRELKQFLDSRKERPSTAVPTFLVLRNVSG